MLQKYLCFYFSRCFMLLAFPALLFPITLYAQALEEIVVTAQRREQSLQEVPVSLEAYTGD
ncbi:MAG: hypothetical protein GTO40_20160, partial [Deltaproteobacteria bacterium]|nr:hypothetical protein [Deltaproteobacteria bacterium]